MELQHLRCFVAVARELHFGRAATQLNLSQPALSDRVRRLEAELGVQLLYRTKRVVRLTEPGQIFLEKAIRLLEDADAAIASAKLADRGCLGTLAIGYSGPALYTVLPDIVRTFRDHAPEVELVLHECCTPDQEAALLAGEIHVGFLHPPIDSPLQLRTVLREPMRVVLPTNHPLATNAIVSIADLADESFVLFPQTVGPHLYDRILSLCAKAGFTPNVVQEVTPQPTAIALAASGIGISFASASMQALNLPGAVFRELRESAPVLELAIAWVDETRSPVLKTFLAVVDDWFTHQPFSNSS